MVNNYFEEAIPIWQEFLNEILYTNRFFPKCIFIDYLEKVIKKNTLLLEKDTTLFRARIFEEEKIFDPDRAKIYEIEKAYNASKGFYGYSENNSGVPPFDKVSNGRANPDFIPYLYLADDKYTSLAEVRPFINSKVSIAQYEVLEQLSLIDFSKIKIFEEISSVEEGLDYIIGFFYSRPINSNEKNKYIPTQYITEYIKKAGFDGIKYRSSLSWYGNNIALFVPNKVKCNGSEVFEVKEITYDSLCIRPDNKTRLIHKKLLPNLSI